LHTRLTPSDNVDLIDFTQGGYRFLKNINYSICVVGVGAQNKKVGHAHNDIGSITISYKGFPLIIDPGTYTYTRYQKLRYKFMDYWYHNTLIIDPSVLKINNKYKGYFGFTIENRFFLKRLNPNEISFKYYYGKYIMERNIRLTRNNVIICNQSNNNIISYYHLHPLIKLNKYYRDGRCRFEVGGNVIYFKTDGHCRYEKYDYSDSYDQLEKSIRLVVESNSTHNIYISDKQK
jgi:hypothetical protein